MNYKQYINDDLDWAVEQIPKQFPEVKHWTEVGLAAACHLYVKRAVDYEVRGQNPRRNFRTPDEMLDVYAGNCQEQTILLVSLLHSVPTVEVRTVSLRSHREKFHMVPEIKFFTERSGYTGLYSFYKKTSMIEDVSGFNMDHHETEDDEKAWFVADPVYGEAVGDISELVEREYIDMLKEGRKRPKDWTWARNPTYRTMKTSWANMDSPTDLFYN